MVANTNSHHHFIISMDNFKLSLQTTLVASSIASIIFFFLYRRWTKKSTAPEAGGAWPVIGHLHLLGGPQPPHVTLGNMADELGPVFTIKLGVHRAIVVSSSDLARECLSTHDKVFAGRPKSLAMEILGYNYAMFGFRPYGDYWREGRKIVTVELLSNHRLEKLNHVRESETNTAVKEIYELWIRNKTESPNGGVVSLEMKNWFSSVTLNVMFRLIAGKRFAGATTEREEEGEGRKAMRDFFEFMGKFVASDAFPMLRWLDIGGYEKEMKKTAKELDAMFEEWLEEHKEKRNIVSNVVKQDEDFMDVMLSLIDDDSKHVHVIGDLNTYNKATSLGLILAGSDTTAVTLTWALSLLLNNRDVLKKAQQELDTHVGRGRQVQESDMPNLVYLQAILKETMRLYPAGPLSLPHESMQNCTVHGHYVPAGTRLVVNISKIHRDPRNWEDPCEFRPERFMTTSQNLDVRGKNFEFIPFSSGRRMCPGVSLALQVMQLALAKLLHGFEIETPFGGQVDMGESSGLTNLKSTPLDVLLSPRLPSQLYV